MRTEAGLRRWLARGAVALSSALLAGPASAQAPLYLVDGETRVGSVSFEVRGSGLVPESRMRDRIATRGAGRLASTRGALAFLPGVSPPEYPLFSPLTLQRDVVRLRRLLAEEGFARAEVDYRVRLDPATNRVHVTFTIDEHDPLLIDAVEIAVEPPDDAWPPVELAEGWRTLATELDAARGRRYALSERGRLTNRAAGWLRGNGFPWGEATVASADTVDGRVRVRVAALPGPRARVDSVLVEGTDRLDRRTVRREIPVRVGDWYDQRALEEGEAEVFELEIVRRALGDLPDDQPRDSTVTVRYRVEEGSPRLVWGRVGYRTSAGAVAEGHWVHRNAFGGARSLTASGVVETGWGAIETIEARRYGLSFALRQPFLGHRRLSLSVAPFGRFRDDFRDESVELGFETGLIYQIDALRHVSLRHEIGQRRLRDVVQLGPVAERVAAGDSAYATTFVTSALSLVASYGRLDDRLSPRSGYLVRPILSISGPFGIGDVTYARAAVEALAAVPLGGEVSLVLRGSAGRLFPRGESDPPVGSPRTRALAGLRGVMFTLGGTGDVRGWSRELLGSKIPDLADPAAGTVDAARYLPAGGLARLSGQVELMLPFPGIGPRHSTFAFFD